MMNFPHDSHDRLDKDFLKLVRKEMYLVHLVDKRTDGKMTLLQIEEVLLATERLFQKSHDAQFGSGGIR